MRGAYSIAMNHQLEHFLYYHNEYVDPRYVLQHDNIIIMGCSPTHVWFSVTDPNKPQENLLINRNSPFLYVGQLLFSQKLIIMTHESFHKLAQELGDPNYKTITFVGMTGLLKNDLNNIYCTLNLYNTATSLQCTVHANIINMILFQVDVDQLYYAKWLPDCLTVGPLVNVMPLFMPIDFIWMNLSPEMPLKN